MEIATLCSHILEFTIAFFFFNTVFQVKRKLSTVYILGLSAYSVMFLLFVLFDSVIVNIVAVAIFNFLFGMIFYKCKLKAVIFSSLFLSVALTASEFVGITVLSFGSTEGINAFKATISNFVLLVLFSRTIYLIIALSVGALLPKEHEKKYPLFLFLFPVSSTLVLYTIWAVASKAQLSQKDSYLIIIASFSIVLSILLTYIFYSKTTKELNELYEEQKESERVAADTAYYSILDRQNEQLKTILHDEKNHLSVIKSMAENPEVDRYIDEIYGQVVASSVLGNTNNKMLDLIINKYTYICEAENIDFNISVKTANLSHIEKSDLIALLGNILDNAVEAARLSKSRRIMFSLGKFNGFDVLTCANSCDVKPQTIGNELKSTKKDKSLHGLGIKSIKRIVKKYNGNFEWSYNEIGKEFTVYIAF